MTLICAICLYCRKRPRQADTIIRGYAVCDGHLSYVAQGTELYEMVQAAREDAERQAARGESA